MRGRERGGGGEREGERGKQGGERRTEGERGEREGEGKSERERERRGGHRFGFAEYSASVYEA